MTTPQQRREFEAVEKRYREAWVEWDRRRQHDYITGEPGYIGDLDTERHRLQAARARVDQLAADLERIEQQTGLRSHYLQEFLEKEEKLRAANEI